MYITQYINQTSCYEGLNSFSPSPLSISISPSLLSYLLTWILPSPLLSFSFISKYTLSSYWTDGCLVRRVLGPCSAPPRDRGCWMSVSRRELSWRDTTSGWGTWRPCGSHAPITKLGPNTSNHPLALNKRYFINLYWWPSRYTKMKCLAIVSPGRV